MKYVHMVLVLMIVILLESPVSVAEVIYSEDFSSNPGWITNNSSHFYWDQAGGRYHYKIIDNTSEYAYHPLDLMDRSFQLVFDICPTITTLCGDNRVGISDVNMSYISPTSITVYMSNINSDHFITMVVNDNLGRSGGCSHSGHFTDGVTYRVTINYDKLTNDVSVQVTERETGTSVYECTITGYGPFLGMDRIFMASIDDWACPGRYGEGYIDNAVVTVNPSEPSPNLIAYATRESGTWELWRLDPNTLAKSRIVSVGGTVIWGVAWSPDGSKIAFANNRTGANEIYVVNADGSDLTQVTSDGASWPDCGNYKPCWVDNEYLLYSSRRVNVGQREIVRIKIDGTDQLVLTNQGGTHDSYAMPWLSPDRTRLTYIKGVPYAAATCKIYVGDYPTFDNQIIVGDIGGNNYADWEPIWSSNDLIAFDTDAGGDIYTVHPDGSPPTNVSLVPGVDDRKPHFSPDGSQIAFLSNETGAYNVWVMNSDGTDRRQLTFATGSNLIGWLDWGAPVSAGDTEGPIITNVDFSLSSSAYTFDITCSITDENHGNSHVKRAVCYLDNESSTNWSLLPKDGTFDEMCEEAYTVLPDISDLLSDGEHTLFIKGEDEYGNVGPAFSLPISLTKTDFDIENNGFHFSNQEFRPGRCFGMSLAARLFKRNGIYPIPHNNLNPNVCGVTEIPPLYSPTRLLIELLQWMAFPASLDLVGEMEIAWSSDFTRNLYIEYICWSLEHVYFAIPDEAVMALHKRLSFSHSVLAYKYLTVGNNRRYIYIYDNNYPLDLENTEMCNLLHQSVIKLSKDDNGYWQQQPPEYQEYDMFAIFTPQISPPVGALTFVSLCPIGLLIIDPEGGIVSAESTTVPNSIYDITPFFGEEGDSLNKVAYIPQPIDGRYTIFIKPDSSAVPSDSFSLIAFYGDEVFFLANRVSIGDMPAKPFSFWTIPIGSISGTVSDSLGGVQGVTVDLFDNTGSLSQYASTDSNGYFEFDSVDVGDFTISIITPLGYVADFESRAITVTWNADSVVNFTLHALEIIPSQRSMGYWKHQVSVYLSGQGTAQESLADMSNYMSLIKEHFNNNSANPIVIFEVSQPATQTDSLEALQDLLTVNGGANMNDRAKQQLTALMLNVVSLKLHQTTPISEDNATVSQAITYCNQLITDSDSTNDETAKNIADQINNGLLVASGILPLTTPNIAYKGTEGQITQTQSVPTEFSLEQNYPNPFNPICEIEYALPVDCQVTLSIYNILGQRVRVLVDEYQGAGNKSVRWDGKDQKGQQVTSGIYFYRIQAGDFAQSRKMVLLR